MTNRKIMETLYSNAETVWAEYHMRQSKSATVIYEETEYVIFAEDKPILEEVQRRLEMSEWHIGTPTEEGWYLIAFTYEFEEGIRYTTDYFKDGKWAFPMVRDISKLRAWQRIEPYKETRE